MQKLCKLRLCKLNTLFSCLLPAFTTLFIFLTVLFVKGIFPFGENLIDYYDMGQTNAPLYYHLWDFLHGRSSLFFDWYINGGQNLAMGSAIQWNISPFNLFFLFIKRELTYPSLSIFMGLHLFFMAFAMSLFLKKTFPRLGCGLNFISSVTYGLCGFTLTHYTIPTYLDTAAFLPIFALGVMRLLRGKGKLMYTFLLAFMTALSYYLGFMHLIYVLLFSGVYITLIPKDREKRTTIISDLAFGTIFGLLMSTFMLLPSVMQMTLSSRFNSNLSGGPMETLISILNSIGADEYYVKYLQLYALESFAVLLIFGLIFFRREWRYALTVLSAVFIPSALIVFESINILWHFGTYYHYPIRCGYLIPFAVTAAAASLAEKAGMADTTAAALKGDTVDVPVRTSHSVYIIPALLSSVISLSGLIILVKSYNSGAPWDLKLLFNHALLLWAAVFVMLTTLLLLLKFLWKLRGSRLISILIPVMMPVVLAELILGAYVGYGLPKFTDSFFGDPEQSGEYISKAQALISEKGDYFEKEDSRYRLERLKNPDTELNTNYGMVIRHATVTGWANTATREQIECAEKLGYSTHFMRILDSGGTFLSDSVLQVRDIVNMSDGSITHNNTAFPFAMAVSRDIEKADMRENSITENNNLLFRALSGEEENIADVIKVSELDGVSASSGISGNTSVLLKVSGRKALYLSKGSSEEIRVNGEPVPVPTIGDPDNKAFPAWFNSNLLFLGIFKDEDVILDCPEKAKIISLDMNKLEALSEELNSGRDNAEGKEPAAGKSSLTFSVTGSEDRDMALIPLSYSPGWSARVNGKPEKLINKNGLFMLLPISTGNNTVEMSFTPPGLLSGVIISLLALITAFCLVYINQFRSMAENFGRIPALISYYVFYGVFILAALFLYVIPIAYFLVHVIAKRM